MHASVHQLLNLRDGEPVSADIAGHVPACARCSSELVRLTAVRERLGSLPPAKSDSSQDDRLWQEVRASLTSDPKPAASNRYLAMAAAAVWAGVALVWFVLAGDVPLPENVAPNHLAEVSRSELDALVAESQRLENFLEQLPRPQVEQVASAATADALEGRIQWLDYALSASGETAPPEQTAALWEQRVELLDSLVALRYAQVGRSSF